MDKGLASISIMGQNHTSMKPLGHSSVAPAAVKGNVDEVRVVRLDEYKEAALCLAEAFKDDHTTHYILNTPDSNLTEAQKCDVHVSMMEYLTYAHILKGLVTTVGENYGAVALW